MTTPENNREVQSALASDLRLHPQRLELGQAEMLTDVLLNRFEDLEQRLNTYFSGSSAGPELRKSMQAYLSRLNANPLIPLHFRLKVLRRFEERLDLFDADMTAVILNAHKIGVDMVQREALQNPEYYRILVDMVAHAINLAGSLMKDTLGSYHAPAVITVRQVFDLMRLGMIVAPGLGQGAEEETQRLYLAIVRYELLRGLDFFSKTMEEQSMMMDELQHHVAQLTPYYLPKDDLKSSAMKGYSLLVTNMSRPNDTAQVITFAPQSTASDHIIIPMDDFIDKLVMAIDRAEKVLNNPVLQSNDLQIEASLKNTVLGGNAILDALRTKSRDTDRQEYGNAKLVVDWSLQHRISALKRTLAAQKDTLNNQTKNDDQSDVMPAQAWTVINISRQGMAIERLSATPPEREVNALVGLHWKPHRGEPSFAFMRWIRYPKAGEQQMGLQFYLRDFVPMNATMLSIGDTKEHRKWPLLASFEADGAHVMVFPDRSVFKGMVFSVEDTGHGG
ncbi:MAG: hypothetical protein Q9N02_03090 [Ghiorsea sp.]|nr:hypothetical protein [Ghiorsea sp.]